MTLIGFAICAAFIVFGTYGVGPLGRLISRWLPHD